MITKTATNPAGVVCNFSAADHRYWTDVVPSFTSVTTFVKQHFPKFDAAKMAVGTANRDGLTIEQVIATWNANRDAACRRGTRVHENQEAMILGNSPPNAPEDDQERAIMAAGWQFVQDFRAGGWTNPTTEQIVFSENMCLAGMLDLAARDSAGKLWILDWKTNATIDETAKYGGAGIYPITHLADCNLVHYALQLGVYEAILRHEGYVDMSEPIDRAVIHLAADGAHFITLPDMRLEVLAMIAILRLNATDIPF